MNSSQPDTALRTILERADVMDRAAQESKHDELEAKLTELASLSPMEYDHIRNDEAAKLHVRVATLDDEVAKRRPSDQQERSGHTAFVLEDQELWPEPVNGGTLLELLTQQIGHYLVGSDEAILLVSLWILFTHMHDAAGVSPILCVTSPEKGCGKTTLLSLLDGLVKRPLPASNVSPAALFRTVEKYSPTLLIDEGDTFLKENEELRGILNSGHTRALAYVLRCEGDNHEVRRFKTWCPKAIALIGAMHPTLADRSIHIALTRKGPHDLVAHLPQDCRALLADLQRKCARWALDHMDQVKRAQPSMPTEFSNRAADNYRPLFAIADVIDGEWPVRACQAAIRLQLDRTDEEETARVKLLADIRTIFQDRQADRLRSSDLVQALAILEDRPWPEWRRRKPITAPQVAKLLKPFKVYPVTVRFTDGTAKGYHLDCFQDAFTRYLPPTAVTSSQLRNDAASSDLRAVTAMDDVTDEKSPISAPDKDCDGETALQGDASREVVNLC